MEYYKSEPKMFFKEVISNVTTTYFERNWEQPEPVEAGKMKRYVQEKRTVRDTLVQYGINLLGQRWVLFRYTSSMDEYKPLKYCTQGEYWHGDDAWCDHTEN